MDAIGITVPMTPKETVEIRDPQAVEWMNDPRISYLLEFMPKPRSVESAAKSLGISKTTMRRWVTRSIELGLLKVAQVDKTGTKFYQLAAERIIVHDDPSQMVELESQQRQNLPRYQHFLQSIVHEANRLQQDPWVVAIEMNAAGMAEIMPKPLSMVGNDQALSPLLTRNDWAQVNLTSESAQIVANELEALWKRIAQLADRSGEAPYYLIHLGMTRQHD